MSSSRQQQVLCSHVKYVKPLVQILLLCICFDCNTIEKLKICKECSWISQYLSMWCVMIAQVWPSPIWQTCSVSKHVKFCSLVSGFKIDTMMLHLPPKLADDVQLEFQNKACWQLVCIVRYIVTYWMLLTSSKCHCLVEFRQKTCVWTFLRYMN